MALNPIDETHALQIQAGVVGRRAGHEFEDRITEAINSQSYPIKYASTLRKYVSIGEPGCLLLQQIASYYKESEIIAANSISTGALATSEEGKKWLNINGANVSRCKSDVVATLRFGSGVVITTGISTKQCNNKTPTNAQLFFTTARGFVALLRNNGIQITEAALIGLRKFCGDNGFRPTDIDNDIMTRRTDPRRYFWEEIGINERNEWANAFSINQDNITRILLKKAYIDDQFVPDFLIHKTRRSESWDRTEVAIYNIEELIGLSSRYQGFATKPYTVKKGSYKDPSGVYHLAPRFGIVQMQRGGQEQHPEQLQFNLEAGYFYKIGQERPNVSGNSE